MLRSQAFSSCHISEDDAVVAEDVAPLWVEELDLVQVPGHIVCLLDALPALPAVRRLEEAAAAAACKPPGPIGRVPNIEEAKAAGLDRHGGEVAGVHDPGLVGEEEPPSAVGQPELVVRVPAHGLHAPRRRAVVGEPEGVAWGPRHVEVASGRHGHVVSRRGAADRGEGSLVVRRTADSAGHRPVEGGIHSLLHRRGPVVARVARHVYRTLIGDHLCLAWLAWERGDENGAAWEL
mmetsp:Transcript_2149/g.5075  ORF Transcript_2149/g.5075 Transcript_2149/m.5075 type:complete len:235 (-) Transcript_2149:661-1365(-)